MNSDVKGCIVNLLGGPAVGKSTLAATLYVELKRMGIDVEYVNEYAKELVYQNNATALRDQILVFANQYHRLWTASEHNKVVITDSPIVLSTIYNPDTSKHFRAMIIEMHNKFNNLNVILKRTPETYTSTGRIHSLTESISLDNRIKSILDEEELDYAEFDPINDNRRALLELIIQEFNL